MIITTSNIENVTQIKMITAVANYGIGFLTLLVLSFCHFFGVECQMYDKKIEKAKNAAASELVAKAKEVGATGIMNVRIQMDKTTILMYGMAYKE